MHVKKKKKKKEKKKKKKVKGSQQTNKKSRGVGITDIPPPLPNLTRGGVSKLSQDATPGGCGTRSPVTEPAATSQAGSSYLGTQDSSLSQSPWLAPSRVHTQKTKSPVKSTRKHGQRSARDRVKAPVQDAPRPPSEFF